MSYRILVLEGITDRGVEILRAEGWTVDIEKALPPAELVKLVPPYEAMLVRSGSQITAEVLDAARSLKVIGRPGVGVDNVDLAAATRRGVIVMNSPGGNLVSTAELAMALMLALARNIAPADLAMKAGKWDRKSFAGVELFGKRLGVDRAWAGSAARWRRGAGLSAWRSRPSTRSSRPRWPSSRT